MSGRRTPVGPLPQIGLRVRSGRRRDAYQSRWGRSFDPAFIGRSNRPRSAMSTCFVIRGTNRISRAAVSGTEYLRHAPSRKKNTILDLSSAKRSCGLNWMRRSLVSAAQPPSRSSAAIQSISEMLSGNLSQRATNLWSGYKCYSERAIAGLRLWLQAASRCSNSSAKRTSAFGTS